MDSDATGAVRDAPAGHRRDEDDAPVQVGLAVVRSFVGLTVANVEQRLIIETLRHCAGNRTHAAQILGISIRTLRNKLRAYAEAGGAA